MSAEEKKTQTDKISFEEAINRLEKIVMQMEEGKLPLEQMMKNFEEADKLAKICSAKLKEVEKKIEILVNKNGSEPQWKDFPEEQDITEKKNRNKSIPAEDNELF